LPNIKVLFITGFAAVALNAQKTGANRNAKILSKPFHLRELVQEVDRILHEEAAQPVSSACRNLPAAAGQVLDALAIAARKR
jgi:FixJ family two-component response regulator